MKNDDVLGHVGELTRFARLATEAAIARNKREAAALELLLQIYDAAREASRYEYSDGIREVIRKLGYRIDPQMEKSSGIHRLKPIQE